MGDGEFDEFPGGNWPSAAKAFQRMHELTGGPATPAGMRVAIAKARREHPRSAACRPVMVRVASRNPEETVNVHRVAIARDFRRRLETVWKGEAGRIERE